MASGQIDEFELLVRVGRYDKQALETIYARYASNVYGLALRVLRSVEFAQDVTQEVFIDLWKHPEKCDLSRGSLKTYLVTKAHSKAIDLIRSESARMMRQKKVFTQYESAVKELQFEANKIIESAEIQSALAELTDKERRAIELTYYEGFSYREAATIEGDPEGTFKTRVRSALSKLRSKLRQEAPRNDSFKEGMYERDHE